MPRIRRIGGVIPAVLLPRDSRGCRSGISSMRIEFLLERGVSGICVNGRRRVCIGHHF